MHSRIENAYVQLTCVVMLTSNCLCTAIILSLGRFMVNSTYGILVYSSIQNMFCYYMILRFALILGIFSPTIFLLIWPRLNDAGALC